MKKIYFIIILIICTYNVLLDSIKCFDFTWPGRGISCSIFNSIKQYENISCIDNDDMPNTTKLWNEEKIKHDSEYLCELKSGFVCVKYLYIYNKAVINASYFCGKVIEDQAIPITTGCYVTYTEGYTIEACACEDKGNGKPPCNSTIRNTYSILTIFITTVPLFIYKIFNIP